MENAHRGFDKYLKQALAWAGAARGEPANAYAARAWFGLALGDAAAAQGYARKQLDLVKAAAGERVGSRSGTAEHYLGSQEVMASPRRQRVKGLVPEA
jgi:hypothetical protein